MVHRRHLVGEDLEDRRHAERQEGRVPGEPGGTRLELQETETRGDPDREERQEGTKAARRGDADAGGERQERAQARLVPVLLGK
jgi:hypothetical protein